MSCFSLQNFRDLTWKASLPVVGNLINANGWIISLCDRGAVNLHNLKMSRQRSADAARFKPKYFYQFRIILIGDSTVGKSSLLRQFTEGQFIENSDPTVGVDFHVRVVMLSCKSVTSC